MPAFQDARISARRHSETDRRTNSAKHIRPGNGLEPLSTHGVEIASTFPAIPLKNNFLVINLNDSEPKLETRQIQPAATPTTAPQKPRFKRRHD